MTSDDTHAGEPPQPTASVANRPTVVLYTRSGCHLCEEARRLLADFGMTPQCVDVDADPELRERFDTCVPVVEIDGRVRFRGRVEPVLLRRLLGRS
jgi:glutaredoxin